jgi:LysR family transcriptional regulator, transcriptional activator for dmlA
MDDVRILRWFQETASGSSFTTTAMKFGVTPAAVSQGIARLEKELGTRLFNRTTRRLHLTAEGRRYLDRIQAGLEILDEAADLMRDAQHEPNGLIRVATISSFGKSYFMPLVAEFLHLYPKVDVEIRFGDDEFDLVGEGFDVAIRRGPAHGSQCVSVRLCDLPIVFVASPDYLARRGVPTHIEELNRHDWVRVRPPAGRSLDLRAVRIDGQAGADEADHDLESLLGRSRITVSEQLDAVIEAILLGFGICVASLHLMLPHLRSGAMKLVLPQYRVTGETGIFIQYPHREYLSLKVRAFIDFLVARFSSDRDLIGDPGMLEPFVADARSPERG